MNIISIKEQFQIINGHIYIVNWGNQNVIVLDTYDYSTHTEAREMNKLEEELYEIFRQLCKKENYRLSSNIKSFSNLTA